MTSFRDHTWRYRNPVAVVFGRGSFDEVAVLVAGRRYLLVTGAHPPFPALARRLADAAGEPCVAVADVAPNPEVETLAAQSRRVGASAARPDVVVALGGGSVIDTAKVLAAAPGDFDRVRRHLAGGTECFAPLPIIAVPTTAGTGSEVTPWATIWDIAAGRKHSLAHPALFPSHAVIDPDLTVTVPRALTVSTGLDALSHALESLWNANANSVSALLAIGAARSILETLPSLADSRGDDPALRSAMAEASLFAGLAFSRTKTAIAHELSYPLTLRHGVAHGVACSFTLPAVLRSLAGSGGSLEDRLRAVFGANLAAGADALERFLGRLGVSTCPADHGIARDEWTAIVDASFAGERGRNFSGSRHALREALLGDGDRPVSRRSGQASRLASGRAQHSRSPMSVRC